MTSVPERWDVGKWDQAHWDAQLGLVADQGTVTTTGYAASLYKTLAQTITANTGSIAIDASEAGFLIVRYMATELAAIAIDGQPVTLTGVSARTLIADPAEITLTGYPVDFTGTTSRVLAADPASIILSQALSGTWDYGGWDLTTWDQSQTLEVELRVGRGLEAEASDVVIVDYPVSFGSTTSIRMLAYPAKVSLSDWGAWDIGKWDQAVWDQHQTLEVDFRLGRAPLVAVSNSITITGYAVDLVVGITPSDVAYRMAAEAAAIKLSQISGWDLGTWDYGLWDRSQTLEVTLRVGRGLEATSDPILITGIPVELVYRLGTGGHYVMEAVPQWVIITGTDTKLEADVMPPPPLEAQPGPMNFGRRVIAISNRW